MIKLTALLSMARLLRPLRTMPTPAEIITTQSNPFAEQMRAKRETAKQRHQASATRRAEALTLVTTINRKASR